MPELKNITGEILEHQIRTGNTWGGHSLISNNAIEMDSYQITSPLEYKRGISAYKLPVVFKNCIFDASLVIESFTQMGDIIFENCEFNSQINLNNVTRNIKFIDQCKIQAPIYITASGANELLINRIDNYAIITISGAIAHCEITNINTGRVKNEKSGAFEFTSAHFTTLRLQNIFSEAIKIYNHTSARSESSLQSLFINQLEFNHYTFGNIIRILDSETCTLLFDNLKGESQRIIEISNTKVFERMRLPLSQLFRTSISHSPYIKQLIIWGNNDVGKNFSINNATIENFIFENVLNEGRLTLQQLTIPKNGSLEIVSSDLKKTDFILCDFSHALFNFQNSKISEVFLSETDFPKKVVIEGTANYKQAQLAFGQLHTAFSKQGDTFRSLEYQAREIESHYEVLKSSKKNVPFRYSTLVNLWFSKFSNDFGRSWIKGIRMSIIVGVLFFWAVVISSDQYYVGLPISCNQIIFIAFFRFLNPLRFILLEDLFNNKLMFSGWAYFWDFLGRIFLAYAYYQTIQAFRKFGRKS